MRRWLLYTAAACLLGVATSLLLVALFGPGARPVGWAACLVLGGVAGWRAAR